MLFGKPCTHAVIDHHALFVGHQCIARTPDRLLEKREGVHAVEQLGSVRATYVQTAEGRYVNYPYLVAHVQGFLLHAGVTLRRLAVKRRALPDAGGHHFCACLHMPLMHGCLPVRVKSATCHMRQLLGLEGRTRCGHAGFADAALG